MKFYFLLWGITFSSQILIAQTATIHGKVESIASGELLSGSSIGIFKTSIKTIADNSGNYLISGIPPGEYDLEIEHLGFAVVTKHVVLHAGENLKLNVKMQQKAQELKIVNVYGKLSEEEAAGAIQREKRANNIINVISAQSMERSPDINAANVLQRMSGLTIDRSGGGDQSYPIIRGLDPRYNNTLINGVKITSPDDKSRYVPLNVVPSDLLGSIEVHKSLLPEMEGDAVGGTVNMVMKDAPDRKIFKVLGSLGYSKIFMDRPFVTFSKADIQQKSLIEKYGSSYTAQPGDFSRSNLDFKEVTPIPNAVFSAVYGQRLLKQKMGVIIVESFQNQYYGSNSIYNQAAPDVHTGQPAISDYAVRNFSTQELNNGLTLHLDYLLNDRNKFTITNTFLYTYLAQAREIVDTAIFGGNGGRTVPGTGPVYTDYTSVTSKQILENVKLDGRHILSSHFLFDWAGVFSYAARRSPDMTDLALNKKIDTVHTTNDIHGPYTFVSTPNYFDEISRIWQHNEDKDYDLIANLTYRTHSQKGTQLELKTGGLYRHKTRYNIQDEYDLKPTTNSNGVKQVFYDIYSAQWIVYNSSGTYDYDKNKYQLFENVTAAYAQGKISFPKLDIVGGLRMEITKQGYSLNTFYATGINGVEKDYTDLLPSAMVKYKLNTRTNIRLSYFKGIARPNYYDLVPALRRSVSTANSTQGNPYLNHSVADNFDLRYEFYPREEEVFSAGIFYKKIQNPIEYAYISGTSFEPQNFGDATDYGAELDFTKYFGQFGITGNYTYLYSEIYSNKSYYNLATNYINPDTLQKRTLQGQTDHTLNLSLLYRNEKHKLFAQVSFQYIGRSIALVYPIYGYDYYQQPQFNLGFSAEKQLRNRHFTVFTKMNNLLNTAVVNEINSLLTVKEVTKFNFSLGLRYAN
jgi:TonB-dependent receptor